MIGQSTGRLFAITFGKAQDCLNDNPLDEGLLKPNSVKDGW